MEAGHTFTDFIFWGFYSLLTAIIGYVAYSVRSDFKETTRSLNHLSIAVAELTIRLASFEKSLDRLDERLLRLEDVGK